MKRLTFILLIAYCSTQFIFGQDDGTTSTPPIKERKDMRPLKDRLWFGGGIGFNFGTVTAIQIDPMVGYKVDQKGKFTTGIGLSYSYFRTNFNGLSQSRSGYGYRPFVRYRIIPQAYLHGEFLHLNRSTGITDSDNRIWVPHILVGGGISQSLGGRSSIFIQVLFEVLQDPNSFYFGQGPVFGGGVGIGF